MNITNSYLAYKDKTFYKYISSVIEYNKDNPNTILATDNFIVYAANKYKLLVQNGK